MLEEVEGEVEEEVLDLAEGSFKKLVIEWNGPDLVYTTVKDWILSDQSGKPTVGNFFQYCFTFSENLEEDYELNLWMLNLVAYYVAKEDSWMDTADDAKDWGSLLLTGDWDVPPPAWAKNRAKEKEEKDKVPLEEKNEKIEESVEGMTSSPLDSNWGKGLPAPSPTVAAHSTPIWRPWAEECASAGGSWVEGRTVFVSNHTKTSMLPQSLQSPMSSSAPEVVNLSVGRKRKKRSPAAAARSRLRLRQWQEKNRLNYEVRTTPQRSVEQLRGTRLQGRLESQRAEENHASVGGSWVEGRAVFFSNNTQNSMLPQPFQSSMSTFAPVMPSPSSKSSFPNVVTFCPSCHARGLLTPA